MGLHHRVRPPVSPSAIFSISDKVTISAVSQVYNKLMGQVPTSLPSEGLTTGDLFLGRPHAPDRNDRQTQRPIAPRSGHGLNLGTMNTLSLGNWLTSLPDTNSGRKGELDEARDLKKAESKKISEVELAELDDLDAGGCIERPNSGIRPRIQAGSPISLETARHLKLLMFGEPGEQNHQFSPGWIGQAFMFNTHRDLSFGFVQHKGGPCGVLAAVQAHLIKENFNNLEDAFTGDKQVN